MRYRSNREGDPFAKTIAHKPCLDAEVMTDVGCNGPIEDTGVDVLVGSIAMKSAALVNE